MDVLTPIQVKPWVCEQCDTKNKAKAVVCKYCGHEKAVQKRKKINKDSLRSCFDTYDGDGNGSIESHEFKLIYETILQAPKFKDSHQDVFNFFDRNGDSFIDYEEFQGLTRFDCTEFIESIKTDASDIKEGFSHLDRGGGRIHITDLRNICDSKSNQVAIEKLMEGDTYIDKNGYIKLKDMVDRIAKL